MQRGRLKVSNVLTVNEFETRALFFYAGWKSVRLPSQLMRLTSLRRFSRREKQKYTFEAKMLRGMFQRSPHGCR